MSNYTSAKVGKKNVVVAGAGQIGTPLVQRLHAEGHAVTWLSRTRPSVVPEGVTHLCVDARDASAVAKAAQGKDALIAAVNPATYDAKVWAEALPPLHEGLIEGAGRAGARLVVLDALYLYATDEGPLSPRTKQAPATEKGKIRKALADMLMDAHAKGTVRATTLRAPDFWGPGLSSAVLTEDALAGMRKGTGPLLVGNPDVPHAFAHRDDVVEGLIALAFAEEDVLGRAYHVPVIHATPRALLEAFGEAFGVKVKPRVAPKWLLRVAGLFSASTRGLVEMLPQWDAPYLVDDSDYRARFGTAAITLEEGVARIAQAV